MQKKYELLKKISLKDFDLLKCSVTDPIYKFCLINNIDNLGDFVSIYQAKRFEMDSRHNFNYFDGFVDLINYIFFGEKLCSANNMLKKIEIKKTNNFYDSYVRVEGDYYNNTIRRFGLTQNETKLLLGYVYSCNHEMSVIVAIKSYLDFFKGKKVTEQRQILLKKLEILSNYYDNNKEEIDSLNSVIFFKAEGYLKKYKQLYKKLLDVKKSMKLLSTDFEKLISELPQEHENVKQLIKSYEKIDCNEI